MTSFNTFRDRNRDMQDSTERHVFGEITWLDTGATVKVTGNGTVDEEAVVVNLGIGQNFPKDTNTEVLLLASGSDTNMKFAIITIPRDKQRQWPEGGGGVQHPSDPDRAVEFNSKRTWLADGAYAFGNGGEMELLDGKIYIRSPVVVGGDLSVNGNLTVAGAIHGPEPSGGGSSTPIPGFDK